MSTNHHQAFESDLSKVMQLGSNKKATQLWWAQRLTAIALIPLVFWFVFFVVKLVLINKGEDVVESISPFNVVFLIMFIGFGIYHGVLGVIDIIEDYIHHRTIKVASIIFLKLFSTLTAITGISAVLVVYISMFS